MGLQTCANTLKCPGQLKRGPTVISSPNYHKGCLANLSYQVALITHCAFWK